MRARIVLGLGALLVLSGLSHAGSTLEAVKKKGFVQCGVTTGLPGFSAADEKEVLDTMIELAESGMTMLCDNHEMGFAKTVANRVIFMEGGEIIEQNEPTEFFGNPRQDRTKLFLSQILAH